MEKAKDSKTVKNGSATTVTYLDHNGSNVATENVYVREGIAKRIKQYKFIVKVTNSHDETSEYIKWSDEVRACREANKLCIDRDYLPSFSVRYPGGQSDGTYIVMKSWAEEL